MEDAELLKMLQAHDLPMDDLLQAVVRSPAEKTADPKVVDATRREAARRLIVRGGVYVWFGGLRHHDFGHFSPIFRRLWRVLSVLAPGSRTARKNGERTAEKGSKTG